MEFNVEQHLTNLAGELISKAKKKKSWECHDSLDSMQQHLILLREALLEGYFWVRVSSVAKSGMSRTLVVAFGQTPEVIWDDAVLDLMGISPKRRISGCGMDMCFAAQYNLFQFLCPDLRYQDAMKRYRDLP